MSRGVGTKMPERSETLADDPFSGRKPSSHERRAGPPWDASYQEGPTPCGIGRPQPAIVRWHPKVDSPEGCSMLAAGTGENALHVAALGLPVLGVDVGETAVARTRKKAEDRGIKVEFAAADAFHLECLGRMFATVLDCGLFHTFDGDERTRYVASLASVTEQEGTLYVSCFRDDGPDTGPHPIRQEKLRAPSTPAGDGISPPSNRSRSRRGTTTTAHRPG
jgi:SAM-dependent methyltransferase